MNVSALPTSPEPTTADWRAVRRAVESAVERGQGAAIVPAQRGGVYEIPITIDLSLERGVISLRYDHAGFRACYRPDDHYDQEADK